MLTLLGVGGAKRGEVTIPETEYLFIDGGCLREAVKSLSNDITGDPLALGPLFTNIGGSARKIFYYDAVSAQEFGETVPAYEARVQKEHDRFDAIQALDRFHVSLGEIKGRTGNRRQKQVDVRLAVDVLLHTFRSNMTRVTLFAGDGDFIPLVEALVREGMSVTVWHPERANKALLNAADDRRPFMLANAHNLLTRDGARPAFALSSSGSGSGMRPDDPERGAAWQHGATTFAGSLRNGTLTMWRTSSSHNWEYQRFEVPDAPLDQALRVYRVASGWDIGEMPQVYTYAPA